VVSIVCALVFASAHLQIEATFKAEPTLGESVPSEAGRGDAQPVAPRDLYTQAAQAIADGELETAVGPLEALVHDHDDSPLANIAVFHLAECYLLLERPSEAVELLATWSPGTGDRQDDGTLTEDRIAQDASIV
jgi:TolA-binding protein